MSRYRKYDNYDLDPAISVVGDFLVYNGWHDIGEKIFAAALRCGAVLYLDCYQGVLEDEAIASMRACYPNVRILQTKEGFCSSETVSTMVKADVGDDIVFGYLTHLCLEDYLDKDAWASLEMQVQQSRKKGEALIVFGVGAALLAESDQQEKVLVYLDMARWEIQQRQRQGILSNLGVENKGASAREQYKHSYFVDWRVLDRHKQATWKSWDWVIDMNERCAQPEGWQQIPKMIAAEIFFEGLMQASQQPFRLVPFFDAGVWGGQWMREVCRLEGDAPNYAWCFDCVPEENSLQLRIGDDVLEFPAVNLVFAQPERLLGDPVHARFGKEFPIRFDFLDTMQGQNLSLQVHPQTEYIQEKFGMHYTQDESYYILDSEEGSVVYLGLQEGVDSREMLAALQRAQEDADHPFAAEKYVNVIPAQKHDHFLIPAGTVHCSGAGIMVLEISATPYIFTFKLWDWGRVGLDGQPRPIHLQHGAANIEWGRTYSWVTENLVNQVELLQRDQHCQEERTGLHAREFLETRRYWLNGPSRHDTGGKENGSVHVLNLIEGHSAIVRSPDQAFVPFTVHYAETWIVPAEVGVYEVEPHPDCENGTCALIKAYVQ